MNWKCLSLWSERVVENVAGGTWRILISRSDVGNLSLRQVCDQIFMERRRRGSTKAIITEEHGCSWRRSFADSKVQPQSSAQALKHFC